MFRKYIIYSMWGCGLDSADLDQGPVVISYEHINELQGSIKGKDFFTEWRIISISRALIYWVSLGYRLLSALQNNFFCIL
jgi:hypothetical protein